MDCLTPDCEPARFLPVVPYRRLDAPIGVPVAIGVEDGSLGPASPYQATLGCPTPWSVEYAPMALASIVSIVPTESSCI